MISTIKKNNKREKEKELGWFLGSCLLNPLIRGGFYGYEFTVLYSLTDSHWDVALSSFGCSRDF